MISKVSIRNFLSYGDTEIEIPDGLGLVLGHVVDNQLVNEELDIPLELGSTVGSNGAGKSGLIEAITWGLWGTARSTDVYPSGDSLIRRGTSDMSVGITITNGDKVLSINRSRSSSGKGTTILNPSYSGYLFSKNINDIQKQIIEIIGMDFNVFKHTYFIKPNESSNFSLLPPAEAKDMVMKILNLTRWERYHDLAKDVMFSNEKRLSDVKVVISTLESQLSDKSIDELEQEISNYNNEILKLDEEINIIITRIDMLRSEKDTTNSRISEMGIKLKTEQDRYNELMTQKVKLEKEIKNIEDNIRKTQVNINNRNDQISRIKKQIDENENKLFEISREYGGNNDRDTTKLELKKDLETAEGELKELTDKLVNIKSLISSSKSKINTFTKHGCSGVCPVLEESCDRVGIDAIKPLVDQLNGDLVKFADDEEEINNIIKDKREYIRDTLGHIDMLKRIDMDIEMLSNKIKMDKESISNHEELLESYYDSIKNAEQLLVEHNKKLNEINIESDIESNLKEINSSIIELNDLLANTNNKIMTNESNIKMLQSKITSLNSAIAVNQSKISEINNIISQVSLRRDEQIGFEDMVVIDRQVVDVFSRDGIPLHLIDASASTIENITNNILAELGKDIQLKIKVESTTKKGTIKDTFEIALVQSGHEVLYKMYSGGESFWIDFALRMALAIVEHNISGSMMDTFIIDEGIGRLDGVNRDLFAQVLKHVCSEHRISQILLVTHTDISESQRSIFDFIITAKKNRGVSSLECSRC